MEDNMIFGVMLILEVLALPLLGLYFVKKAKPNLCLLLILLVGVQLRFFAASDQYLHDWDEKYHALVAKHLTNDPLKPCLYCDPIEDYDYKQWTNNHIWLHKPPMSLWVMGAFIRTFGANELALRLPSVILSLLSVFLTFLIGGRLYSKQVGVIAAFFLSINGFYLDIGAGRTTTDHVDCAFLFFVLLCIYLSILFYSSKNRWLLPAAASACGLALLTKWLPALLVVGLFGLMGLGRLPLFKNMLNTSIFTAIALLFYWPWRAFTIQHYPLEFEWEQNYNFKHLTETLEGQGHAWWYYLDWIRIIWNEAIYPVLLFFIWNALKRKNRSDIMLLAWLFVPILVFSFSATKMPGYMLICAPAAFLAMAIFCEHIALKWKHKKLGSAIVVVIVLLSQRYCIERVKPFENRNEKEAITVEIKRLKKEIGNARTVLYGNPFPIETMFYADYISYASLPTPKGMKAAREKNYQVAVIMSDNLPDSILNDSTIILVNSALGNFVGH